VEKQEFDSVVHALSQSPTPGNEQRDMWSSQAAQTPNSRNVAGIQDPVVDDLIEKIIQAPDYDTLKTYVKALDRVLLFGYYMVPGWKIGMSPVAYWDRFSMPETLPSFEPFNPEPWWIDADKNAKIQNYLGHSSQTPPSPSKGGFLSKIFSLFKAP
jgi:microcin C transport system substrate-binding protein